MLFQGDQGLAKRRDFMAFCFPLGRDVEVDDAKEKEKTQCKENQLWLQ